MTLHLESKEEPPADPSPQIYIYIYISITDDLTQRKA